MTLCVDSHRQADDGAPYGASDIATAVAVAVITIVAIALTCGQPN